MVDKAKNAEAEAAPEVPIVSVIVPAYNCERYIEQCVKSALGQTLREIELICVNDGSTDGTLDILKRLAEGDDRMVVIDQPNAGEGAARNTGMAAAQGTWLAFFDADDFADKHMLKKMVQAAERKNADIAVCGVKSCNAQTGDIGAVPWGCEWWNYPRRGFSVKDNPDKIFSSFHNWAWNKIYRADFIRACGLKFDEVQRSADLYFVMCALVQAERIVALRDSLYCYRMNNPESNLATSDRAPLDFAKSFIRVREHLEAVGKFALVERAFKNWAVSAISYNFTTLRSPTAFEELRSYLLNEGLAKLGVDTMSEEEFFDSQGYQDMQHLQNDDAQTYLFYQFRCANVRAEVISGSEMVLLEKTLSSAQSAKNFVKSVGRKARNTIFG